MPSKQIGAVTSTALLGVNNSTKDIQEKINLIDENVDLITAELAQLLAAYSNTASSVVNNSSNINDLTLLHNNLRQDHTNLSNTVGTQGNAITSVTQAHGALRDEFSTLEQEHDALALAVDANVADITTLEAKTVGGVNLISGTKDATCNIHDNFNSTEFYKDAIVTSAMIGSSTYKDIYVIEDVAVDTHDTFTLSFDIRGNAPGSSFIRTYFDNPQTTLTSINSQGLVSTSADGRTEFTATENVWERVWVTWTQGSTTLPKRIIVARMYDDVSVARVKFETGNYATDWTPSLEDVESAITDSNRPISDSVTSTFSDVAASSKAVKTVNDKIYDLKKETLTKSIDYKFPRAVMVPKDAIWASDVIEDYLLFDTMDSGDAFECIDSITLGHGGLSIIALTTKPSVDVNTNNLTLTGDISRIITTGSDMSGTEGVQTITVPNTHSIERVSDIYTGSKISTGIAGGACGPLQVSVTSNTAGKLSVYEHNNTRVTNVNGDVLADTSNANASLTVIDTLLDSDDMIDYDFYNQNEAWALNEINGGVMLTFVSVDDTVESVNLIGLSVARIVATANGAYVTGYLTETTVTNDTATQLVSYHAQADTITGELKVSRCLFNIDSALTDYVPMGTFPKVLPAFFYVSGNVGRLLVPRQASFNVPTLGYDSILLNMSTVDMIQLEQNGGGNELGYVPGESYFVSLYLSNGDSSTIKGKALTTLHQSHNVNNLYGLARNDVMLAVGEFVTNEFAYTSTNPLRMDVYNVESVTEGDLAVVAGKLRTIDPSKLSMVSVGVNNATANSVIGGVNTKYPSSGNSANHYVSILSIKDRSETDYIDVIVTTNNRLLRHVILDKRNIPVTGITLEMLQDAPVSYDFLYANNNGSPQLAQNTGTTYNNEHAVEQVSGWLSTLGNLPAIFDNMEGTTTSTTPVGSLPLMFDYIGMPTKRKHVYSKGYITPDRNPELQDSFSAFLLPHFSNIIMAARKISDTTDNGVTNDGNVPNSYQQKVVCNYPKPPLNVDQVTAQSQFLNLSTVRIRDTFYALMAIQVNENSDKLVGIVPSTFLISYKLIQTNPSTMGSNDIEYAITEWQILRQFEHNRWAAGSVIDLRRFRYSLVSVDNSLSINVLKLELEEAQAGGSKVYALRHGQLYMYDTVTGNLTCMINDDLTGIPLMTANGNIRDISLTAYMFPYYAINSFNYAGIHIGSRVHTLLHSKDSVIELSNDTTPGSSMVSFYTDLGYGRNGYMGTCRNELYYKEIIVQDTILHMDEGVHVAIDGEYSEVTGGVTLHRNQPTSVANRKRPMVNGTTLDHAAFEPNLSGLVHMHTDYIGGGYDVKTTNDGPVATQPRIESNSIKFYVNGQPDKFYPVLIPAIEDRGQSNSKWTISRGYDWPAGITTANRYSPQDNNHDTHMFGLVLAFNWQGQGTNEGGDLDIEVLEYVSRYASGLALMDGHLMIKHTRDGVIVLLRGDAEYSIHNDMFIPPLPMVHTTAYYESAGLNSIYMVDSERLVVEPSFTGYSDRGDGGGLVEVPVQTVGWSDDDGISNWSALVALRNIALTPANINGKLVTSTANGTWPLLTHGVGSLAALLSFDIHLATSNSITINLHGPSGELKYWFSISWNNISVYDYSSTLLFDGPHASAADCVLDLKIAADGKLEFELRAPQLGGAVYLELDPIVGFSVTFASGSTEGSSVRVISDVLPAGSVSTNYTNIPGPYLPFDQTAPPFYSEMIPAGGRTYEEIAYGIGSILHARLHAPSTFPAVTLTNASRPQWGYVGGNGSLASTGDIVNDSATFNLQVAKHCWLSHGFDNTKSTVDFQFDSTIWNGAVVLYVGEFSNDFNPMLTITIQPTGEVNIDADGVSGAGVDFPADIGGQGITTRITLVSDGTDTTVYLNEYNAYDLLGQDNSHMLESVLVYSGSSLGSITANGNVLNSAIGYHTAEPIGTTSTLREGGVSHLYTGATGTGVYLAGSTTNTSPSMWKDYSTIVSLRSQNGSMLMPTADGAVIEVGIDYGIWESIKYPYPTTADSQGDVYVTNHDNFMTTWKRIG